MRDGPEELVLEAIRFLRLRIELLAFEGGALLLGEIPHCQLHVKA
jgi:hypothetical protein